MVGNLFWLASQLTQFSLTGGNCCTDQAVYQYNSDLPSARGPTMDGNWTRWAERGGAAAAHTHRQAGPADVGGWSSESFCVYDGRRPGTAVKGCGVVPLSSPQVFITCLYVINDWFEYKFCDLSHVTDDWVKSPSSYW